MTLTVHAWEDSLMVRAYEAYQETPIKQIHDNEILSEAYAACRQITAENSKSFYIASGLLPDDKRQAVRALYAFCRVTDDIVDTPTSTRDIAQELSAWRRKTLDGHYHINDLVPVAWNDTRSRHNIPSRYIKQLIDGVARDMTPTRYTTFSDLADYAYGVASTVGLMSMHIIGFNDPDATYYAIKLGVALQMTNILRDVGQDWQIGRVYLPQDELDAYHIDQSQFETGRVDDNWRDFMRFQIDRTRQLYSEAQPGINMLEKSGRLSIAAAADLYSAILNDIEAHDYDVFSRRAFVSKWGKLRRIPALWWRTHHINNRIANFP